MTGALRQCEAWLRLRSLAHAVLGAVVLAGCASTDAETQGVTESASSQEQPHKSRELVTINGLPASLLADARNSVQDLLDRFETSGGEAAYVDDAAYELRLFLLAQGYAGATVSYGVGDDGTARIDVEAGERSTLGEVHVELDGDAPLTPSELARYVNGPRTGLFGRGDMLYVSARVARAPRIATDDLIALGHLDAEVTIDDPGPSPDGGPVEVTLLVNAGPRYTVSATALEFIGDGVSVSAEVRKAVLEALHELVKVNDDEPATYDPRLGGRIRSSVNDALARRGYPDAHVMVDDEIDRAAHRVALAIEAEPGPLVTVTEVRFVGDGRTNDKFLASRLQVEPGQTYDAQKIRQGVRRLYRSGIFAEIRPRLEGDGESRVLVLELVEQPSLDVYFEPGYGSYELFRATVGVHDRNLFGSGINGLAEVTVAVRALRARLRLTDPYFLADSLIGVVELEYQERVEPSFTRETLNIGSYATKEWTDITSTTFGYRYGLSDAKDVEANTPDPDQSDQAVNIASLILSQWFDTRNAILAPTRGLKTDASMELALQGIGSELSFFRTRVSSAYMASITPSDVAAFGLHLGVIVPIEDSNLIPIQERFFAGGENSVRSYRESQLGPKDANGQPIGGESFATASLEWRHQVAGPFQTAAFVDVGHVALDARDIFDPQDIGVGVGLGFRYMLPIGPLRLDAAVNPDPDEFEEEWVIHFSIGMPF